MYSTVNSGLSQKILHIYIFIRIEDRPAAWPKSRLMLFGGARLCDRCTYAWVSGSRVKLRGHATTGHDENCPPDDWLLAYRGHSGPAAVALPVL